MAPWFQYQAKAEPVFVPGEDVTLDKWYQPAREPVRRVVAIATLAMAFVAPVEPIAAAPPYDPAMMEWHRQTSEPVLVAPRPQPGLHRSFIGFTQQTVTVWVQQSPQTPVWAARPVAPWAPAYFAPVEPPAAAPAFDPATFPHTPPQVPVRARRQAPASEAVEPLRFAFPESALDWHGQQAPSPPRRFLRPQGGSVEPVRATFPETALDWQGHQPASVAGPSPRQPGLVTGPVEPPAPAFDPAGGFPYPKYPDFAPGRLRLPWLPWSPVQSPVQTALFTPHETVVIVPGTPRLPSIAAGTPGLPSVAPVGTDLPSITGEPQL